MSRRPKTTAFWFNRLPHWEVENGKYFVTVHLHGAIPKAGRERLFQLSENTKQHTNLNDRSLKLQRKIFSEMELWLDQCVWNPKLQQHDIAPMIQEAIHYRIKENLWIVHEYVVMPTHIHLFCEVGNHSLREIVHEFKRWTGNQANKILNLKNERFWQIDWFDHWSRSDQEDEKIIRYIRQNPVKANLVNNHSDWPYGSWSHSENES